MSADRTDWQQVFAEPDGGFLAQESAAPVRVHGATGSWVPVNTTLAVRPDGSLAPGATVPGLALSGGGPGPVLTVSQATGEPVGSVSLSWPYGPLPRPTLAGATATYANVLPGVNLLVTAEPTGADAVLQVMNASAAADPRLANIRFPMSARGLSVTADGQGGMTFSDTSGGRLFTEPPAQMWDSAGLTGAGSTVAAAGAAGSVAEELPGPIAGDHVGVAGVTASAGSVSLSPALSVLSGPAVVYPVYIDPAIFDSHTQTGWQEVGHDFNGGVNGKCSSQGGSWDCWGNWDYQDPAGGIRAGVWCNGPGTPVQTPPASNICYDSNPDSSWGVYRTYLNFNLPSALAGAAYVDAQLSAYNVFSYNCSAGSELDLVETHVAQAGQTWATGSRPGEIGTVQDSTTKAYGNPCNPNAITLNATGAVTGQETAGKVTLEMRASLRSEQASPPDLTNWRRFEATGSGCAAAGSGGPPCLQVFWMHLPNEASAIGTELAFNPQAGSEGTHCATTQSSPDYVDSTTPMLDGSVTDADVTSTSNPLTSFTGSIGWTDVTPGFSDTGTFGGGTVQLSNNSLFQATVPSGTFVNGHEYEWQAYGVAQAVNTLTKAKITEGGPSHPELWSSPCYVTIDGSAPAGAPLVSSSASTWTVGQPGQITITDPAYSSTDSDLAGFFYSVGSGSQPVTYVAAVEGTATVTVNPLTTSTEWVYAQAVDNGGGRGPVNTTTPYEFTASRGSGGISALARWTLNGTGTDQAGSNTVIPAPDAYFAPSPPPPLAGYTTSLEGEADTAAGVVSPQWGFTVSAWVSTGGSVCAQPMCVAMSEDAAPAASAQVSVFQLAYQPAGKAGPTGAPCPCWVFQVWPGNQQTSNPVVAAISASKVQQNGSWTQLDGVFNPGVNATLYVDGSTAAAGQQSAQFTWSSTEPGPFRLGAGLAGADAWPGNVSDACVFYGAMTQQSDISALYASGTGDGCQAVENTYG